METVFALSSGSPPAGIAVVRVSGPEAGVAIETFCGRPTPARMATLCSIKDSAAGGEIDRGLVVFFPGPHSFTGEDVAEFQVHGGRAIVARLLRSLGELPRFRPAEQGEFTRRAFNNGRLDLTQAEGIADLISADTEDQRYAALQQTKGSIRSQYESWAESLLRARALLEAQIDFAEDENLGEVWASDGRDVASTVLAEIETSLAGYDRARAIREGLSVVLLGPVNAGKSTLLNAVAGRDVAIVTAEPGTTRDLIEVPVDLGGRKVTFIDSAGLRSGVGFAEREGIRRARARAGSADLVLWLSDCGVKSPDDIESPVWSVATKIDLLEERGSIRFRKDWDFAIAATTGEGMDDLVGAVTRWASSERTGEALAVFTRERHRRAISDTAVAIQLAIENNEPELAAENLRVATEALGRLSGRVDADSVLDIVFHEFCIGK